MKKAIIVVMVLMTVSCCIVAWYYFSGSGSVGDVSQKSEDNVVPYQSKPPQVAKAAARPAQPSSTVSGEETPLVKDGRKALLLPPGAARTDTWTALLEKASYEELVRFTEIPAQPTLDEERVKLRQLTVQKLGQKGLLLKFIEQRQQYDDRIGNPSKVLLMALQEWSKTDSVAAARAWYTRLSESSNPASLQWWTEAFAAGLKQARPSDVVAALENLPLDGRTLMEALLHGK